MLFILSGTDICYVIHICRIMAFWNVMLCGMEDTNISEDPAASICGTEEFC